ncbi:unnamed protein product [Calicophoron daubneyi]|uniref:Transcription initiation factor IIA subunit 1 n=1 Tax=Calicophoron daubneyi TaxID=300641 RepID=A0AAV2TRP8_CALDB
MTDVSRFYNDVIEDVINGVKDELVEDGVDAQVLDELRKLWKAKLAETHVFDPEPTTTSAAQYLNLLQRSQLQVRPSITAPLNLSNPTIALPVRQLNAARVIAASGTEGGQTVVAASNLSTVRLAPQTNVGAQAQQLTNIASARTVRQPSTANNLINNLSGTVAAQLQPRGVLATGIQSGGAPQLAALPSGLTGHLVQIGQQTYLVPQSMINLRQPGTAQLPISQLVGATTSGAAPNGLTDSKSFPISDPSAFRQTQVDGGHDSDDEKFCDTPSTHHQTPNVSTPHRPGPSQLGADRSVNISDLEEDDDDDDDDFVAATPGLTPSSLRSPFQSHRRGGTPGDLNRRDAIFGGTPLMSAPPTPMTPASVASRPAVGDTSAWRRAGAGTTPAGSRPGPATSRKRRRRSSHTAGDTDTEPDDEFEDDDDDVGDDVELMTTATMTPADHTKEEEDDDEHIARKRSAAASSKESRSATQAEPLSSPTSQIGDAPEPQESGAEGDLLQDEEEEEDEEPLNSGDDVSDEEPEVLFESDNVVVCQYDKIHRSRNKWRFHLKDGIMAINGRDHVFQKALGEAEW